MQSTVEYSDDKNHIIFETDTNGISSAYTYNENGIVSSVTDGNGKVTSYASNAMGYLTLAETNVTGLADNAVKMAIKIAQGTIAQGTVLCVVLKMLEIPLESTV